MAVDVLIYENVHKFLLTLVTSLNVELVVGKVALGEDFLGVPVFRGWKRSGYSDSLRTGRFGVRTLAGTRNVSLLRIRPDQ